MHAPRPRVLFVTDLAYLSKGRRYCDEDIFLSSQLREWVDIALCHPLDALALMDDFDAVVVRNSGPVLGYQDAFDMFARHARENGTRVFTQLTAKETREESNTWSIFVQTVFRSSLPSTIRGMSRAYPRWISMW